ncbi:hypothetical protein [Tessaracoccus defluvii]|nr:hypothetical protein [Tessaracoccus defluvii]
MLTFRDAAADLLFGQAAPAATGRGGVCAGPASLRSPDHHTP